jgi:hypothetical protein
MEILNSGYSLAPENYHKPTPKWVKMTADALLLLSAAVVFLPEIPASKWIMFGGAVAKLLSKFITDNYTT